MADLHKLPDAEFDVMRAIWDNPAPVTTRVLMDQLGNRRGWKAPALITLLARLAERGFVRSEKHGKEREYYPLVGRDDYFQFETEAFVRKVHGGSLTSLMASLDGGRPLSDDEAVDLLAWLAARRERHE